MFGEKTVHHFTGVPCLGKAVKIMAQGGLTRGCANTVEDGQPLLVDGEGDFKPRKGLQGATKTLDAPFCSPGQGGERAMLQGKESHQPVVLPVVATADDDGLVLTLLHGEKLAWGGHVVNRDPVAH